MINWDEQLAKQAEVAAKMEAHVGGGGQFFSLKAGILAFNGAPMPGNQMAVVILDHCLENVHYEGKYDESNPQGPSCFAFGRDDAEMAPHQVCVDAGTACAESCVGCPNNEWASAETGKGKACRNTRRLALIPAGEVDNQGRFTVVEDPQHYTDAEPAYLRLPVTSIKGFATFVKQLAETMRRPPHGVATLIRVVPDQKNQFRVLFEPLAPLPNQVMGEVMRLHEEQEKTIMFPYQAPSDQPAPQPQPRGRQQPARPAARPVPAARPQAVPAKAPRKF